MAAREFAKRQRHNAFRIAPLREAIKPFRLHWFSHLRSTNETAARLRRVGKLFSPAVVVTSRQTAGRGRGSNTWWSGPGCLTATFAFPIEDHLAPQQLPLLAGLAVRNAVAELSDEPKIGLKWPNDVIFENCKLAGLLCERVDRVDLIGIGLNVNLDPGDAPPTLRKRITSLLAITGHPFDQAEVLCRIAQHLRKIIQRRNDQLFPTLLREYDRYHSLKGVRVAISGAGDERRVIGRCEGIDDQGRLILKDGKVTLRIIAGHVEIV